jgi:hypothetical protein
MGHTPENSAQKPCSRCGAQKPLTEYGLQRGKPRAECRECNNARARYYFNTHRDRHRERLRGYMRGYRAKQPEAYREQLREYARNYSRARYWANRQPSTRGRTLLFYPYHLSAGAEGADLVCAINNLVPRSLPESVRADVCQELALAVLSGGIEPCDLSDHVGSYIREQFRFLPNRFHISLDADEYVRDRVGYLAAQLADSWGCSTKSNLRRLFENTIAEAAASSST